MSASLPQPAATTNPGRLSWPDIVAGLSLAGLLLPEAVAYSGIANLPPQAGVIALFAGLVCYGLMGTSRFAIVSATSSSAAVLAAASASMAAGDNTLRLTMAIGMVMLTGLFFLLAGLARIGSVSDFIAKPVLRGFSFGLALVIIFKQLAGVVGVYPQHADLIRFTLELFERTATWNWMAGAVTLATLALLFLFARIPRLPGGLLVIILGIAAGKWLHLEQYGIGMVGAIALPLSAPALPGLAYSQWLRLGEVSVALVLILYAESYSSIRSFAIKHGDGISPNRDLLTLGAANIVSGLFHGMPVGAGYSATAANEAAGAQSRWAGWTAAFTLFLIVLTMLPAIALTPNPVLAAIVIHAVGHTLRPAVFRPYFLWHRDRLLIVASVLGVLLLGVLDGLLAAIAVSLLMQLRRLSESSVTVLGRLNQGHDFVSKTLHPDAQAIAGMLILRPETSIFFANAERVLGQVRGLMEAAGESVHTLVLSLEESPDLDSSSVEALVDFCAAMQAQHKHLLFARLKAPVQQVLGRAAIAGLPTAALSDLSVDDVVGLADKLYPRSTSAGRITTA
ncbi:SulP family inorganic anion transporter [Herbaspirillum sp. RTI4]|uniref:SulP family inorganic anion transporter n=1 Tax=Herbaspirillum sp. RTI4 TaxID=3048640 RepID=UPI002AB3F0D1|nr:SulP family inorganic anion transporter [Herbaspirillum sp. RTI4]MDY7579976.1 SulP family inorganic anion transporter [Herbaspirillum sp. RTI4]MEA9982880.1 SulP family inorganic anion transporter [Herbaspirillum sp. RTI4]